MPQVLIRNLDRPQVPPVTAKYCSSFMCRLRGLMFCSHIPDEEGLLLVQSRDSRLDSSIHMLGMLIDLAVVWINANFEIVDVKLARRWRPAYLPARPARFVLEMAVSRLEDFNVGEKIAIES